MLGCLAICQKHTVSLNNVIIYCNITGDTYIFIKVCTYSNIPVSLHVLGTLLLGFNLSACHLVDQINTFYFFLRLHSVVLTLPNNQRVRRKFFLLVSWFLSQLSYHSDKMVHKCEKQLSYFTPLSELVTHKKKI